MRHLAVSSANSGSLGKLERPLLMLLPTRKSHALHTGQEIFHMRHNRQKHRKGKESDYNVSSSSDWHFMVLRKSKIYCLKIMQRQRIIDFVWCIHLSAINKIIGYIYVG